MVLLLSNIRIFLRCFCSSQTTSVKVENKFKLAAIPVSRMNRNYLWIALRKVNYPFIICQLIYYSMRNIFTLLTLLLSLTEVHSQPGSAKTIAAKGYDNQSTTSTQYYQSNLLNKYDINYLKL